MPTGKPDDTMTTGDAPASASDDVDLIEVEFAPAGAKRTYWVIAPSLDTVPKMLREGVLIGIEAPPPHVVGEGRTVAIPTGSIHVVVFK